MLHVALSVRYCSGYRVIMPVQPTDGSVNYVIQFLCSRFGGPVPGRDKQSEVVWSFHEIAN